MANEMLETMIDNVIRRFGFEHEKTIGFCKLIENYVENPKAYKLNEINLTYNEIMK